MEIIYKKVDEIIPYENNPRKNEEAVEYVANSIKEFGFKVPIVIDKDGVIIAGHTRLKGAKKLGLKEVPCIIADDLTEEQVKAFRLADNKVGEIAEWDFDLLNIELDNITDIDMEDFGFDFGEDLNITDDEDNPYTTKINIPQYEIKGEEPEIDELVNVEKTNELIKEIESSNVSDEQKQFLIKAAQRHLGFNYSKVAEYYAHQDKEMQELMEKSALVIIDFEDAIKNGYAELSDIIDEMKDEALQDED